MRIIYTRFWTAQEQDIQNNFEIKYIAFPTSVIYLSLSSGSGSLVDSFDL